MPGSGSGRTRITGSPSRTWPSRTTQAFSAKRPAESAANIAKDLGIALERIGIKSIEGLSGMREYGTAVPGSGSAIDRFSTAENTSRSEVLRDLKLIQTKDYEKLSAQTVEIKRMLTVLVQKLTAES